MASTQVVETSVTNNSPSQDSYHPDDLFQSRYATPGFKPFSYDPWTSMYWFYTRKENKLFCETYRGWRMSEEISHFSNRSTCIVNQKNSLNTINNSISKWKLSAPDIQELLLLAGQLLDETAPMAGKSLQPSHEPLCRREEGHLSYWCNKYKRNKEE